MSTGSTKAKRAESMKDFAERIAEYACGHGYPITEQGFLDAMNDYIASGGDFTRKLNEAGRDHPIVKRQFYKALAAVQ